jgi:cellobiose transport system permease protein
MATAPPAPIVESPVAVSAPQAAPPKSRSIFGYWRLYLAISPFYLLFLCFGLIPVGFSLYLSFHRWDGLGSMEYAGLSQYSYLLSDTQFWHAIGNTLIIWAISTLPMLFIALVTAVMLNSAVRFKSFYRFAYFLPNVTSVVAIAIIFGSVFSTNFGLVNAVLQGLGLDQIAWLNTPWGIKVAIASLMTWQWTGYNAIIFLAGLQTIPSELYEAAELDGAGLFKRIRHVTIPQTKLILLVMLMLQIVATMQVFIEPYLLTGGGPENATLTVAYLMYQYAFNFGDFGAGGALGLMLMVVLMVFSAFYLRLSRDNQS